MSEQDPKGLVIVYTGNGKGKTTAALGLMLRAWGRDMKVVMLQFIKHSRANFGEHRAAKRIGLEMVPAGTGFIIREKDKEKGRLAALELWEVAREKIRSGEYRMVILDEFSYPLQFGWITVDEVLQALRDRPAGMHVVITGRDVPQGIIDSADLVTEMKEVKHPYRRGIKAQPGVEF
jgi:cob(I)alamin adenosyltransferase